MLHLMEGIFLGIPSSQHSQPEYRRAVNEITCRLLGVKHAKTARNFVYLAKAFARRECGHVGVRKRGIHVLAILYQSIKQPTFFISYQMLKKSLRCQEDCLSCGALFDGSDSAIV